MPYCYSCHKHLDGDAYKHLPLIINGARVGIVYVCHVCKAMPTSLNTIREKVKHDELFKNWRSQSRHVKPDGYKENLVVASGSLQKVKVKTGKSKATHGKKRLIV